MVKRFPLAGGGFQTVFEAGDLIENPGLRAQIRGFGVPSGVAARLGASLERQEQQQEPSPCSQADERPEDPASAKPVKRP